MQTADVIVVGLGAMGAAAAFQLSKRGLDVVGIDRYSPPHANGSSHGETRITRQAIGEGGKYVPLVLRTHEIWRELEVETGEDLLLACGTLVISSPANTAMHHGKPNFLTQTVAAARQFGIEHEELGSSEIRFRFPQFLLAGEERGYFEPGGGLVYPERCVEAQLGLARQLGADIRTHETVASVEPIMGGVRVRTDRETYEAEKVVLAAGAWTPGLAGSALGHLAIHRQMLFWFVPEEPAAYTPERCPVFIWMHGSGTEDYMYGFPTVPGGAGVKVATEFYGDPALHPELVDRNVTEADAAALYDLHVAGRLAGLTRRCIRSSSCLYTTTPDGDFIIDHHPDCDRILILSPCSGHGFKHSAAIGEAACEIVADGRSRIDLSGFGMGRFASALATSA